VFAPVTIALNGSFVSLWVGKAYFAGNAVTALLLLATVLVAIATTDQTIADAMFAFRQRAFASLVGGLVLVGVAVGGRTAWGLSAIALGLALGRLFVAGYGVWLIPRRIGCRSAGLIVPLLRPLSCLLSLCAVALAFATRVQLGSWPSLIVAGAVWASGSLGIFWVVGMNREQRRGFFGRLRSVIMRPPREEPVDGWAESAGSMVEAG
jgi:hypothetical protein